MKKLTYEFVKSQFESKGYILLEDDYSGTNHTIKYKCSCGATTTTTYNVFQKMQGCGKNHTVLQETVEVIFKEKGCELLDVYVGNSQPMKYRCSCGLIAEISYADFKKRGFCMGKHTFKINQQEAEKIFEENDCKLLDVYINDKTKVKYICSCGGEFLTTLNSFKSRKRCKQCGVNKSKNTRTTNIEKIKCTFSSRGYTLLSTEYKAHGYLTALCPLGHEYITTLSGFNAGNGCKICANLKNTGENNSSWNPDREQVKLNKTIWMRWRNLIRSGIVNPMRKNNQETKDLLGYTWDDLRKYLENHPNWKSIKNEKFQIDHISPVTAFHKFGIKDPKIICALDNLQPLLASENRKKWDYYDENKFKEYLGSKNVLY